MLAEDHDSRFCLYADDLPAARAALLMPNLVAAIDHFSSLVLDVDVDEVGVADPADANLWARYRAEGLSRGSANAAPMLDVAAQVHLSVHELLAMTARASA